MADLSSPAPPPVAAPTRPGPHTTGSPTSSGPTAPAISIRGLTRRFGDHTAVDGVDLDVAAGEILVLLGPNGAGKTTTVRLLNGILAPHAGASRVLGLDPTVDGEAVRERTGVLTENAGLDDRLTARENLAAAAAIRGMPAERSRARIDELFERFGIAELADRRTTGFSTGQRKRVALARALLHDPDVLFLDEPTSGLDPTATRDVTNLIASLAADHGRTVVLATHFLGEAGRLPARMAVLDHGRLVADGHPETIARLLWHGVRLELDLDRPADPEVHRCLGAIAGTVGTESTARGASVTVDDRSAVPRVLATLTARGIDVFGADVVRPTLEDVYFEIERRVAAGEPLPAGLLTPPADREPLT